jgi:hypothetical protein
MGRNKTAMWRSFQLLHCRRISSGPSKSTSVFIEKSSPGVSKEKPRFVGSCGIISPTRGCCCPNGLLAQPRTASRTACYPAWCNEPSTISPDVRGSLESSWYRFPLHRALPEMPPQVAAFLLHVPRDPPAWRHQESEGERAERQALENLGAWTG